MGKEVDLWTLFPKTKLGDDEDVTIIWIYGGICSKAMDAIGITRCNLCLDFKLYVSYPDHGTANCLLFQVTFLNYETW